MLRRAENLEKAKQIKFEQDPSLPAAKTVRPLLLLLFIYYEL